MILRSTARMISKFATNHTVTATTQTLKANYTKPPLNISAPENNKSTSIKKEVNNINLTKRYNNKKIDLFKKKYPNQNKIEISENGNNYNNSNRRNSVKSNLTTLTCIASGLFYAYFAFKNNHKEVVILDAVTPSTDQLDNSLVIHQSQLEPAGSGRVNGRSGAVRVKPKGTDGLIIYYSKRCFSLTELSSEIVIGVLAHQVMPEAFPQYYLAELPVETQKNKATYNVLSKSKSDGARTMDLEDWANLAYEDRQVYIKPQHLGVALAWNAFWGNSDTKLANLVLNTNNLSPSYSIDHEHVCAYSAVFIASVDDALETIGELKTRKSFFEIIAGNDATFDLDTNKDVDQPLASNKEIKAFITPILAQSIQDDIDNKRIEALYHKLLELTAKDIDDLVRRTGGVVSQKEADIFKEQLAKRQAALRKHLGVDSHNTISLN